jgi:hypothetical protein
MRRQYKELFYGAALLGRSCEGCCWGDPHRTQAANGKPLALDKIAGIQADGPYPVKDVIEHLSDLEAANSFCNRKLWLGINL